MVREIFISNDLNCVTKFLLNNKNYFRHFMMAIFRLMMRVKVCDRQSRCTSSRKLDFTMLSLFNVLVKCEEAKSVLYKFVEGRLKMLSSC